MRISDWSSDVCSSDLIASSGRMKAEPTFVAAYWWRVHPGKEDQFRAAWRRGTELIREKYGSLGSRLHREARPDGTTRLVGIAEWPHRATWQAAIDARKGYDALGRAACRANVCQYVWISRGASTLKKQNKTSKT